MSTYIAGSLLSLTVSHDIVFSQGGDSKNNLLRKTAIQLVLTSLEQGIQTSDIPLTALQKLGSYYSNLAFFELCHIKYTDSTQNGITVATTNQIPPLSDIVQAILLHPYIF